MSDIAIRSVGLSKQYKLGHTSASISAKGFHQHNRLSETVARQVRAWGKYVQHLLTSRKFGELHASPESKEFWALQDISFEIPQGASVGIIGRNGAGKSTLLKILSRITEPTRGLVEINGRVASLLEVGTGFHGDLTGRENIFLNGSILGMTRSEIKRKFDAIVDFAGVSDFLDTPVKRYSSGMYVRLAFSVAAHLEPQILIVDEVLAVGDLEFQTKCLGKMQEIASGGRTILFVSHNLAAVQQLCSRAIYLNRGQLMHYGPVNDCLDKYLDSVNSATGKITSHISLSTPELTVTEIRVNGSNQDHQHLDLGENTLIVEATGLTHRPVRANLQARLLDSFGTPIGIASPGLELGNAVSLPIGPFGLTMKVTLPRLNRGLYKLTFEIVEPNVTIWSEVKEGLSLSVSGTAMANGQVFDVSQQLGWLILDSTAE